MIRAWWDIDIQTRNKLLSAHRSARVEESAHTLGTAGNPLCSLVLTYVRIFVVAVVPMEFDCWETGVEAHVERAHRVIFTLDRVMELHHRG